jgi:hypothetical protein
MKRFWQRAVIVTVSTALLTGIVPQVAQAAPQNARPATAAVAATVASSAPAGALASVPTSSTPASVPAPGDVNAQRIPIGPILSVLRRLGAAVYNAALNAVRGGWAAFQRWWNGLSGWQRWLIETATGGTAWTIFKALSCWLTGALC